MRFIPSGFIGNPNYDVHGRLLIQGFDLTEQLGKDALRAATWTAHMDQLATSGTITLDLGKAGTSLTPFQSTSTSIHNFVPLALAIPTPGRSFALQTNVSLKGLAPLAANWMTVWDGFIDAVSAQGSTVVLECRDRMGMLQDRIIEPGPDLYGFTNPGGILLTTLGFIAQQSLSAEEYASVSIQQQSNPEWTVIPHFQDAGISVAEALHRVVLERGWAFHYRYVTGSVPGTGIFYLYDPERDDIGEAYDPVAAEIIDYTRLRIDSSQVRNVIEIIYGANRDRFKVEDTSSVGTWGRKYMLFSEDANSEIDTLAEAETMARGALADLKNAGAEVDYERFYFPWVELADKHHFTPDNHRLFVPLDTAVVGYTHTLNWAVNGQFRSTIRTVGSAVAAKKRWLKTRPRMTHTSLIEPVGIAPTGASWGKTDDLTLP